MAKHPCVAGRFQADNARRPRSTGSRSRCSQPVSPPHLGRGGRPRWATDCSPYCRPRSWERAIATGCRPSRSMCSSRLVHHRSTHDARMVRPTSDRRSTTLAGDLLDAAAEDEIDVVGEVLVDHPPRGLDRDLRVDVVQVHLRGCSHGPNWISRSVCEMIRNGGARASQTRDGRRQPELTAPTASTKVDGHEKTVVVRRNQRPTVHDRAVHPGGDAPGL